MASYAVKHVVEDQGLLAGLMKDIRRTPYSYTSNEPEASQAAMGNDIYVIEVRAEPKGGRSYWLGYKYRAYEKYPPAGGGLWRSRFKFKNAARPIEQAEGAYFDVPVEITDAGTSAWLREKTHGMAEIPAHLVAALDAMLDRPEHGAKPFS